MPPRNDEQLANDASIFYGLNGGTALLDKGIVPAEYSPDDATQLEKDTRRRLRDLTRKAKAKAGPKEAAALQLAGLPMISHPDNDGTMMIDTNAAVWELTLKAAELDQKYANNVRSSYYGLNGSVPFLTLGVLPSQYTPDGASDLEKTMRSRLYKLVSGKAKAGPMEALELKRAGLPTVQFGKGTDTYWVINAKSVKRELTIKAVGRDEKFAAGVREFYFGPNGSTPSQFRGILPKGKGKDDRWKNLRRRLNDLSRGKTAAGPLEALELKRAGLPIKVSTRCVGEELYEIDDAIVKREGGAGKDESGQKLAADAREKLYTTSNPELASTAGLYPQYPDTGQSSASRGWPSQGETLYPTSNPASSSMAGHPYLKYPDFDPELASTAGPSYLEYPGTVQSSASTGWPSQGETLYPDFDPELASTAGPSYLQYPGTSSTDEPSLGGQHSQGDYGNYRVAEFANSGRDTTSSWDEGTQPSGSGRSHQTSQWSGHSHQATGRNGKGKRKGRSGGWG